MSTSPARGARWRPPHLPRERPGPAGGVRDANRRRRTDDLCNAALELFLARGLDRVTIDDIATRAGVAKGSFYRYFRDKEELTATVLAPLSEATGRALEEAADAVAEASSAGALRRAYQRLGARLAAAVSAHPDLARLYLQESRRPREAAAATGVRDLADRIVEAAERLTVAAQRHRLLRTDTAPDLIARFVVGGVERLLGASLAGELDGRPDELGEQVIGVVLEGIGAPGRHK